MGRPSRLCTPSRNSTSWQAFLTLLEQANPTGTIAVITDNLSSHSSLATRVWLAGHPRIQQVFIPKGACWLNLQEAWWRIFRRHALAGADLRRLDRDRPRHRAGHRPAQQPCQTLGLGTATLTTPTPPTALYLPTLRNPALELSLSMKTGAVGEGCRFSPR
jgi:hypothetical protein